MDTSTAPAQSEPARSSAGPQRQNGTLTDSLSDPLSDPLGLPDRVRGPMEGVMGVQLKDVKVGEGDLPGKHKAEAVTENKTVTMAPGRMDLESRSGLELLGHELAHVAQQGRGETSGLQPKGGNLFVDQDLEAKADSLGSKGADAVLSGDYGTGSLASLGSSGSALQPKVRFKGSEEDADQELLEEKLETLDLSAIYDAVFAKMPTGVTKADYDLAQFKTWVKAWREHGDSWEYSNDTEGYTKLAKHIIKFHVHQDQGWNSIGVAEYMTGDATGLSLAPQLDDKLSVKVLKGKQTADETKHLSFYEGGKLPGIFENAKTSKQVREKSIADDPGTSKAYSEKYNAHTKGVVKPWNKETWKATEAIGSAFKAKPNKTKDVVKDQMLPKDDDEELMAKIKEYKETKLGGLGSNVVLLWGRTSGANGGAHKELDSHKMMMLQLADTISKMGGRTLVPVGDEAMTAQDLSDAGITEDMFYLGRFWKDETYGKYLSDRNAQRYLFKLLTEENNAVSIGMRSGSLEGMALLDMKVIFIDDKGNNAAGRMEFWAGDAADGRAEAFADEGTDNATYEKAHEGPLKNYKRLATACGMGEEIEKKGVLLEEADELLGKILNTPDRSGVSLVNEIGTDSGNKHIKKLQDAINPFKDSQMAEADWKTLLKAVNSFGNSMDDGAWGKDSQDSKFKIQRGDYDALLVRADTADESKEGTPNRTELVALLDRNDSQGNPIVYEDETSKALKFQLGRSFDEVLEFLKGLGGKLTGAAEGGRFRFKKAEVEGARADLKALARKRALQDSELAQAKFLMESLAPLKD